jgi:hypothetical protein
MAAVKFCFPNWTLDTNVITPTATGAAWTDLANLKGEVLSEMARCPSLVLADSKFVIDLGTTRNISVLAIPFHNAQIGNLARMRLATDAGFADVVVDTGWKEFFGEVYPWGTLPWGHVSWVDGRLNAEQAYQRVPPWMHVLGEEVLGRYLEVQLDFTGNTDGFVDVGQIVAASALSPVYNASRGVTPPFYVDASTKTRAKGGPMFADRRKPYRVSKMQLQHLSLNEAYGSFFEMVRELGVSKPFFFIYNSDAAAAFLPKQSFMAIAEEITPPVQPYALEYSMAIEITEQF